MRTGVLVEKVGMTRIFDEFGTSIPVTVLSLPATVVIEKNTANDRGYNSVKIASSLNAASKHVNKAQLKQQTLAKKLYNKVKEFRVSEEGLIDTGTEIKVSHYIAGQYVDAQGRSVGKGFAGGMKRHGFAGLEATHGVSISHRSHGSTGQCQDPGRVFKGKKMAGHLGDSLTTIQNLEIVEVDTENSLILVKGSVPGKKGTVLALRDSLKKSLPIDAPMPTFKGASSEDGGVEADKTEEAN